MTGQPNTDTLWMERLREDDEAAFAEIYGAYREKLLAVAFNRLSDIQAAEDIVQDVFVSLWNQRHNRQISNAGAYLATAVKYKVLDRFRREQLLRQYQEVYQTTIPVQVAEPETAFQQKHMLQLLQQEVNKLPEKSVVSLFSFDDGQMEVSPEEGFSREEIFSRMDAKLAALMQPAPSRSKILPLWLKRTAVAAGIALALGAGLWFLPGRKNIRLASGGTATKTAAPVMPGSNKAILLLDDGSSITLNDSNQ